MSEVKIELDLDEKQWPEIYYALDCKLARVVGGFYGFEGAEDWARELREIMSVVARALEEKGVNY